MNGLDNLEARRHVNRLCLAAETPLIESGTAGYLGQVDTTSYSSFPTAHSVLLYQPIMLPLLSSLMSNGKLEPAVRYHEQIVLSSTIHSFPFLSGHALVLHAHFTHLQSGQTCCSNGLNCSPCMQWLIWPRLTYMASAEVYEAFCFAVRHVYNDATTFGGQT